MVPMSLSCKKPAINDENPDVRQAAVYGIGICAGLGGSGSVTCWSGGHVMVLSGKRQRPVQVPTASASNDSANCNGGEWIIRFKKVVSGRFWEDLVMDGRDGVKRCNQKALEASPQLCYGLQAPRCFST
ncbi:hypothetical protein NC653_041045 [Populus alba x Populus x berolinensis]|uniref:Uncharacterized protein n=1 Tax=Populus alba x Populus x berolinensis TaxID=444605 RepID=A0AAD6PPG3_9ROSI|nr:hypothetical protein NC653_041045 [Populus alba x Populus x berolinensis]